MADPLTTGQKVLAALDAGRAKAVAQARARSSYVSGLVLDLAHRDIAAGRPTRGRAKRIALGLRLRLSVSQVGRILRTLSSVRDSACDDDGIIQLKPTGEPNR